MSKKKISVQFQVDINSLKTVGKITEGQSDPEIEKINLKMSRTLKNLFSTGLANWVPEFNLLIENGNHIDAYNLLVKNKWTVQFSKPQILDNLLRLDKSKLNGEQRKDFLIITIIAATKEGRVGKVENEIDMFLSEFGESVVSEMRQSILLAKGNAAAQNEKINVANNIYRQVIDNVSTSNVDKAYAYRGLAKIAASKEDIIQYHNLSADKFLEAGQKHETITDMVYVSRLYEKESPEKALKLIDNAILLYDSENTLDKEFKAGLHHRKAGYLFSLNKFN